MTLEELGLRKATINELKHSGIFTAEDLTHRTQQGLTKIPGIGRYRLREIETKLERVGMRLARRDNEPAKDT